MALRSLLFFIASVGLAHAGLGQEITKPRLAGRIDSLWAAAGSRPGPVYAGSNLALVPAEIGRWAALRAILETEGYPGTREVGLLSCERFWTLLQAADGDPALQQLGLRLLKEKAAAGAAPPRQLAWLQDRILVNAGQPQLYGTQIRLRADSSSFEPRPVDQPECLDARRAALGLPPMAEYILLMNQRYRELLKPAISKSAD